MHNRENFRVKRHEGSEARAYSMCTERVLTNFKKQISTIKRQNYMENIARGYRKSSPRRGNNWSRENKVTSKFCHRVASGASGKLFRKVVGAFVFYD